MPSTKARSDPLTTNPVAAAAPFETVRRGAVEIPFQVLGPATGRRMLFAHPLMVSGTGATPAMSSFVDAGWCVLTLDQRGVGAATAVTDPADFALDELAGDLLAVLDAVGWERCWFAGGSMGAATSLAAAVAAPDRVEGLALVAPAFGRTPNAGIPRFDEVAEGARTGGTAGALAARRRQFEEAGVPEADMEGVFDRIRALDPATLAALLSTVPRWSLAAQLDALPAFEPPVVVVAWDGDPVHPMDVAEEIVRLAPNARLIRLASAAEGADPGVSFPLLERAMSEADAAASGDVRP